MYMVCDFTQILPVALLPEIVKYIEDIQFFGRDMPFISSSEAKNAFCMSSKATNEINFFSLHEMK